MKGIQKLLHQSGLLLFRRGKHSVVSPPKSLAGLLSILHPFTWTQVSSYFLLKAECLKQDAKFQSKSYQVLTRNEKLFFVPYREYLQFRYQNVLSISSPEMWCTQPVTLYLILNLGATLNHV